MQGQIQQVDSRSGQYGVMWRVNINGTWYGAGKVQPPPIGTFVSFDESVNARGYKDAKNIVAVQGSPPQGSPPHYAPNASQSRPQQATPYKGGKSQEEKDYWNKRDAKEEVKEKHYQARWAVSQGLEFAIKAAAAGLVKFPAKASEEDKRQQVLELGLDLASTFLKEAANLASGKPPPEAGPEGEDTPPVAQGDGEDWGE